MINDAVEDEIAESLAETIEAEIASMINDIQNYPSGEWFQLSDGSYVCFTMRKDNVNPAAFNSNVIYDTHRCGICRTDYCFETFDCM